MTIIGITTRISKLVAPILFLSSLATVSICAQTERRDDLAALMRQHAIWDPAQFILDKLRTNRIVMIADFGHGVSLYQKVVINALDAWITAWERSSMGTPPRELPSKLFLVLEMDSIEVQSLKSYFLTGNAIETLRPDYFAGNFTIATLEFYYDLKTLRHRIDSFNRSRRTDATISFDIVGPEKPIDPNVWTAKWSDQFYAYERDEYSSARISALLDSFPDSKALIYYGGAHLDRQKVPKLGSNQGWGYFIAHYLSEHFASEGGVYTCGQLPVLNVTWLDEAVRMVGKTFAMDNSFLRGVAVGSSASFIPVDGVIYHFSPARESPKISVIPSEDIVKLVLARIGSYTDTSKPLQSRNLILCLEYLSNVALKDFRSSEYNNRTAIDSCIKAWQRWHQSSALNIVEDLSSLKYFRTIVERMSSSDASQFGRYQRLLAGLTGFKVWFPPDVTQQERVNALPAYLDKYRKPIVIENLIRLLWIGSRAECARAIALLKRETGENFDTAKQWTSWWEVRQSN